jgi:hypothetical protein
VAPSGDDDWPTTALPGGGDGASEPKPRSAPAPRRASGADKARAAAGKPRSSRRPSVDDAEEPPYDPGFDPGDEPLDDGATAMRESSEQAALRLLTDKFGAEVI